MPVTFTYWYIQISQVHIYPTTSDHNIQGHPLLQLQEILLIPSELAFERIHDCRFQVPVMALVRVKCEFQLRAVGT